MSSELNIVALIPARGGSKGIKNKNLYPILGKPLIQYTIESALKSNYLSEIHLNTEDQLIKKFCMNFNIDTSYNRPISLAQDDSPMNLVIADWLLHMERSNKKPEVVVLLQPTSPLRTETLIDNAIEHFLSLKNKQSLVGVNLMKEHPYKSIKREKDNWSYLVKPPAIMSCRQMYDSDYFVINGSIYIASIDWLRDKSNFVIENESELFMTSCLEGVDVDELSDIYYVESLLKNHVN